jgi:hypothetical protein
MIHVALKEWAVVCELLVAGEQALLVRKGGIEEAEGPGRFRLASPRFALFPAWLHQEPERITLAWRDRVAPYDEEPAEVVIAGFGVAEYIWQAPSREAFDALDDLHCWTPEHLDKRWQYKSHQPLYVLAVRAYRLANPRTVANNPRYAGCRSWIEFDPGDAIDDAAAMPALSDDAFASIVTRVATALAQ